MSKSLRNTFSSMTLSIFKERRISAWRNSLSQLEKLSILAPHIPQIGPSRMVVWIVSSTWKRIRKPLPGTETRRILETTSRTQHRSLTKRKIQVSVLITTGCVCWWAIGSKIFLSEQTCSTGAINSWEIATIWLSTGSMPLTWKPCPLIGNTPCERFLCKPKYNYTFHKMYKTNFSFSIPTYDSYQ